MSDRTKPPAAEESFTVELRFFANFRQAVGQKLLDREFPGESIRIGEILEELEAAYPDLDLRDADGAVREYVSILKNGTDIVHLDGQNTRVEAGDRVSLFPPVAGG